jgi:hypothetical protein
MTNKTNTFWAGLFPFKSHRIEKLEHEIGHVNKPSETLNVKQD